MHNVSLSCTRSILINYKSRLETSSRHYRARSMLALRASLSLFCLSFVSRCEGEKLIYRSGASTYFTLLSQASLIVVLSDSLFSREQDYREERPDFNSTSPKERREGRIKKEKKRKKRCRRVPGLMHGLSHIPTGSIYPQRINRTPSLLEIRSRSTSSILFPRMISIRSWPQPRSVSYPLRHGVVGGVRARVHNSVPRIMRTRRARRFTGSHG